jgi:hypothetical protein
MTDRTIWFQVFDITKPAAEPFMVVRIDTSIRRGTGCEGTVVSLHWNRVVAEIEADRLNAEVIGSKMQSCQ